MLEIQKQIADLKDWIQKYKNSDNQFIQELSGLLGWSREDLDLISSRKVTLEMGHCTLRIRKGKLSAEPEYYAVYKFHDSKEWEHPLGKYLTRQILSSIREKLGHDS